MPDLLTTRDAGRLLGVLPRRVRALVEARSAKLGRQVGQKLGRDWVFTADEVELLRPGPAGWPKRTRPA